MYDMICRDHVISAITWLEEHNSHYADIKLNEHWYNDIAAKERSVQIDENCNHITVTEDAVHDQPLQKENTSKHKLNKEDNQQLFTKQIESTHEKTIDTEGDDEDTELVEEQAAVNHREELTDDPLPGVVQFENLENQIYRCAPGENNIPKYILWGHDFEVLAFPDLFPYGGGGYHNAHRKVKLPIKKYFQQCLLNVDGRFAQNIEYLFCAQYIADIKQIKDDATFAIMLSQGRTLGGHKITAGHLWNPAVVEQLVRNEQAYKFLKNVRASPAYWQNQLYDVLAMLQKLGIPSWFLTLPVADLHWSEMIQTVAIQFGRKLSQKDILKMSIADRSRYSVPLCTAAITKTAHNF